MSIPILSSLSAVVDTVIPGFIGKADHGKCTFKIADGALRTDDLTISSTIMSLIGTGSIDFAKDVLDMDMRVNVKGLPGLLLFPVSKLLEYHGGRLPRKAGLEAQKSLKHLNAMTQTPAPFKGRRFGAHTSIAGGVLQAVGRAQAVGFTAAQIFVKSNKQWLAPAPLSADEAKAFRAAADRSGILFFGHSGYLINLGSGDPEMEAKSVDSLTRELERAEALGLPFVVHHPGSPGDDGEEAGLERISSRLKTIFRAQKKDKVRVQVALEITAGQGRQLGAKFEHLREIIDRVGIPERLGVCLDTAHLFAAGYDLRTLEAYKKTMAEFEKVIGAEWLRAFHLNDSKVPFASRKDRHDHLGEGEIGLGAFRLIVADKRWRDVPMVLETPKEEEMAEDVANLKKLQPFIK